jgi:hypothetical protein
MNFRGRPLKPIHIAYLIVLLAFLWIIFQSIQGETQSFSTARTQLNEFVPPVFSAGFKVSAVTDVVAATGITVSTTEIQRIQSSTAGDSDISADPQIANGYEGQLAIFHCEDDTKTVTFDDGTGLHTTAAASFTCGARDMIIFLYINADWVEQYRANN